jgi:hypothetical protein
MTLRSLMLPLVVATLARPIYGQSLADVAKKAQEERTNKETKEPAKVYSNKDVGGVAEVKQEPLSAADAAIDTMKFDKTYAAGKAVAEAKFMNAVSVTPRQFEQLQLAFKTEISMSTD